MTDEVRDAQHLFSRREFLAAASAGLGAAALASVGCEGGRSAQRRPNLVFVFSDQQSHDMLGCYGNAEIQTPHIDRFAAQGVRFAHCVSNAPMCAPYRGILMTGQHPLYNGCYANDFGLMTGTGKHFGHVLTEGGYRTAYIGKWHLLGGDRNLPVPRGPARHGFDGLFLSNNVAGSYEAGECFYWNDAGEKVYMDAWEADAQTDQALAFLEAQDGAAPFALFLSWHPPHPSTAGYRAPERWMQRYDLSRVRARPHQADDPRTRRMFHGYMAMCSALDEGFGRILAKLEERGVAADTLVVYTSDHGDLLNGYARPFGKASPEDPSLHVPLILRWPRGLPEPRVSELLFGSLDLMPTLLALLGLPIPPECQGRDLGAAIRAADDGAVESLPLMGFLPSWRGVYTRRHTFATENFPRDREAMAALAPRELYPTYDVLYDRAVDPWTTRNLYTTEAERPLREELARMSRQWLDRFEDPFVDHNTLLARTSRVRSVREFQKATPEQMTCSVRPIDALRGRG